MQIFLPYKSPIDVARSLDPRRLNKQIIECRQILAAIDQKSSAWSHHPVVLMYREHRLFVENYMYALESYQKNDISTAEFFSTVAIGWLPWFVTEDFIIQHRRRLYTKDKDFYKDFSVYGESDENWYVVNGKLIKYKNGKIKNEEIKNSHIYWNR